jgi:catechol 2,3-dioxygenase-like lactoylglutathione lyase family enzyme
MLHHIGLTVSDLERSIDFYCAILGCTVRERSETSGFEVESLTGVAGAHIMTADLELDGGTVLELLQYLAPRGERLAQMRFQPGHSHVGFRVDDVDAAYERLAARGAEPTSPITIKEPGSAWDGVRAFYALDPDGRTVECLELAPGDRGSAGAR